MLAADEKSLVKPMPGSRSPRRFRISGVRAWRELAMWPGTLVLAIKADGTFNAGPIAGRWKAESLEPRTYL